MKLAGDDDLAGRIDAVNLEHLLGQIEPDRGNLHGDAPPFGLSIHNPTLALDAVRGPTTPLATLLATRSATGPVTMLRGQTANAALRIIVRLLTQLD